MGPRASTLATIVNYDPIYVTFPVSQRQMLDFRRKAAKQGRSRDVVVRLRLADGTPTASRARWISWTSPPTPAPTR